MTTENERFETRVEMTTTFQDLDGNITTSAVATEEGATADVWFKERKIAHIEAKNVECAIRLAMRGIDTLNAISLMHHMGVMPLDDLKDVAKGYTNMGVLTMRPKNAAEILAKHTREDARQLTMAGVATDAHIDNEDGWQQFLASVRTG